MPNPFWYSILTSKTNSPSYPEELADRAWDNVGLLQENINPTSGSVPSRVLLTNDLTLTVAEEAIKKNASVIVSYRTTTPTPHLHLHIHVPPAKPVPLITNPPPLFFSPTI